MTTFAVLTGGGTGGHVYPAVALAQELVRRGRARDAIRFVGAARGVEAAAVPEAGFAIDLVPGRGIRRSWTPAAVLGNIRAVLDLVRAFVRCWRVLGRARPRVVVGTGGWASAACVVAARLRRIPTVVHEQNAVPGLANRVAVALGARAAVSLPGTPLRGAERTGNPVRAEIAALAGSERAPVDGLVAFVGGSLGARTINQLALGLYDRWRHRTDVRVHHVAGRRDFAECRAALESARRADDVLDYSLVEYEHDMADLYRRAALVVARAGGITVAELAVAGVPSVLIPLPGAPADHQTGNAQALASAGGAIVVRDDAAHDLDTCEALLDELLADDARRAALARGARALARPDAAARLADLVEEVARGG